MKSTSDDPDLQNEPGKSSQLGERIQKKRKGKGWTQSDLADKSNVDPSLISRYENGAPVSAENLQKLAAAFDVDVEDLTTGEERSRHSPHSIGQNPKPIRLGEICLENVYILFGHYAKPFEFDVQYTNVNLKLHRAIRPIYSDLAQTAAHNALKLGHVYYPDGPCVRLLRIIPKSRQLKTGREEHGAVLELAPVNWEQYTVLNELLLLDNKMRTRFADVEALYRNGLNLSWCALSNILTVSLIPITKDGFGLVQRRSRHGVSSAFRVLTAGVNENIHRYLDEAAPSNLSHRLHSIDRKKATVDQVWKPSNPDGVPSPLLAAQRGVFEELSPELHRISMQVPGCYKFLTVVFDFFYFHPYLLGVVELDMTRSEVQKIIEEYPPESHPEYDSIEYLLLSKNDPNTSRRLSDRKSWGNWGLAAFITAMNYWEQSRK